MTPSNAELILNDYITRFVQSLVASQQYLKNQAVTG